MNGELIDQDQYVDRMQRVTKAVFDQTLQIAGRQSDPQLDAGAVALISILREMAIDQLAKQKGVVPSDDSITSIMNYQRAADPTLDKAIKKDPSMEDLQKRSLRLQEEVFAIGTDGAQVDNNELKTEFEADRALLDVQAKVGLRVLGVKDESEGLTLLGQLKATGDFRAAERQEQSPPPFDGTERFFPVDSLQKSALPLYDAVKSLNPGQFAPAPVTLTLPTQSGQSQSLIVLVQLTDRLPAKKVTLEQVRPIISQRVLQKSHPQMNQHVLEQLNEYLQNQAKTLEIYSDRYKGVVMAYLFAPPQPMMAPAGAGAPPGAQAPNAPPPGTPGSGAP
jgi:hypothetical protein